MRPRELAGNLALALGAGALFLGLLEGGARLVEKRRAPRPEIADYIWDWDDKMPGGFYVMKSDGVGWPPWEEFNADGLRDRTRTKERPGGYRRIAFLGDSVTLGAELTRREAYPQLLESHFVAAGSRTEVMNVALWGWSTRQERTAWQKIARAYQPDQAVLAVCLNDIPELQNNLARPPRWLVALHERLALVRLLISPEKREIDSVERLFSEPDSERVREAFARFFEEVRALRLEVVADGASFALVVFPFRFQVEPGAPTPLVQQRIAEFCRDERLSCLDLLPVIGKVGAGAFRDYDHLSPSGHVLVADTLRTSGLLVVGDSDPRVLREALGRASDAGSRSALRWLIGGRAVLDAAALEAFEKRLADDDASVRQAAAWGLASAGPAAAPKATVLGDALAHDHQPGVRMACARALGAIGSRLGSAGAARSARGSERERARRVRAGALPHRAGAGGRAVAHGGAREPRPLRCGVRGLEPREPRGRRRVRRPGAGEGARARRDERGRGGGARADRSGRGGGGPRAGAGARQRRRRQALPRGAHARADRAAGFGGRRAAHRGAPGSEQRRESARGARARAHRAGREARGGGAPARDGRSR